MDPKVYKAHKSIRPFHESTAEVKALCGPVGSGKSLGAGMEWFFLCLESPTPMNGVIIRESYRQLHDSTRKTLEQWFPPDIAHYKKQDETLYFTMAGADGVERTHSLAFRHARRAEDASNLLSTEYGFIQLEEAVPAFETTRGVIGGGLPRGVFDLALTRLRQAGVHRRTMVVTFNPPSTFHWTYDAFFKATAADLKRRGMALFRSPARENAANLPEGYYERLSEILDPEMARRFVEGEPVTIYPGKRVYPEAYEQTHFVESLEYAPGLPLVLGFDYGLTPVCLICQVLPSTALRVLREVQMWDAGVVRLAAELSQVLRAEFPKAKMWRCWGDPAGSQRSQTDESTTVQVLAANGFHVNPGAITFTARREAVKQRLTRTIDNQPAVLIDRHRCPTLTEGLLGGYRYPKGRDERIGTQPQDNDFTHVANALEYICTGEYSIIDGERLTKDPAARPQGLPPWNPLDAPKRRSPRGWMTR